jgi:hypothetical protein
MCVVPFFQVPYVAFRSVISGHTGKIRAMSALPPGTPLHSRRCNILFALAGLVATVADPKAFRSGRNFSAWIGLVPNQHSSGGKDRLGSISNQGDRYLLPGRRACHHALCQDSWHQASVLAHGIAGAAVAQGCCYRACQQDRADGLGHDDQRRALEGTMPSTG